MPIEVLVVCTFTAFSCSRVVGSSKQAVHSRDGFKKAFVLKFFTLVTGTTEGCRWICGAERKQIINSGWSNLENHFLSAHKEQYFAVKDARDDDPLPLTL